MLTQLHLLLCGYSGRRRLWLRGEELLEQLGASAGCAGGLLLGVAAWSFKSVAKGLSVEFGRSDCQLSGAARAVNRASILREGEYLIAIEVIIITSRRVCIASEIEAFPQTEFGDRSRCSNAIAELSAAWTQLLLMRYVWCPCEWTVPCDVIVEFRRKLQNRENG